ncbi:hypothetical protein CEXT_568921 [Caerostris extrusa]|uniref:Uncharacterized protein n=1 Tax=Caerostris extrusa TaxID=172846 RepID=A0AAV4Y2G0_CAEEX|nr:hypothetical protein CEXT_568921 [Caerostris extrusa]
MAYAYQYPILYSLVTTRQTQTISSTNKTYAGEHRDKNFFFGNPLAVITATHPIIAHHRNDFVPGGRWGDGHVAIDVVCKDAGLISEVVEVTTKQTQTISSINKNTSKGNRDKNLSWQPSCSNHNDGHLPITAHHESIAGRGVGRWSKNFLIWNRIVIALTSDVTLVRRGSSLHHCGGVSKIYSHSSFLLFVRSSVVVDVEKQSPGLLVCLAFWGSE